MKIKVNFDRQLLQLNGESFIENDQPVILSKAFANNLVNQAEGDAVKFYDWGLQLYRGGFLELDRADFYLLKKFIENLPGISILYKAQLLECFILKPEEMETKEGL